MNIEKDVVGEFIVSKSAGFVYLIIPGSQLMGEDPQQGIDLFINGEFGTGVRDLKLTFELYGYSGDVPAN